MRELRLPLLRAQHRRVLAALAHLAVDLAARLPLHPARRQPPRRHPHLREPDDHDVARRALAWRGLDLRGLGRTPRRRARGPARCSAGRRDAPEAPGHRSDPRSCGAGLLREHDIRSVDLRTARSRCFSSGIGLGGGPAGGRPGTPPGGTASLLLLLLTGAMALVFSPLEMVLARWSALPRTGSFDGAPTPWLLSGLGLRHWRSPRTLHRCLHLLPVLTHGQIHAFHQSLPCDSSRLGGSRAEEPTHGRPLRRCDDRQARSTETA